ncbi:MAG TPA: inositol monophosphatase family protein [Gammaproteobacteria bacterium]|nr:inositol monophosphatase family protein [Gammaproteobacteria bacterium]
MGTANHKIFGIGLSKTGTTSLAQALGILGYKTKDYPGIENYRAGDLSSVDLEVVDAYDALTDTPIPSFYRELDARYPNSKFILTIRDRDGWLKSCKKQFTERLAEKQTEAHNQLFIDLYGCTVYDEQKFLSGYEKFVSGALEYFKGRPQDLLVINVIGGEGWEKLCPFLGQPVPEIPFPKANVTQITWMNIDDIVAVAKRAGQATLRAYQQGQATGVVGKALYALRGGDAGALQRATRAAHKVLVDGLKKLNAQIPVLSRESSAVPYSERAKWNHLWLVDPLDGAGAFLGADGAFTINIALVQDGAPIYGVVYAPVMDTVYYARIGKGAFKMEGAAEPRRLDVRENLGPKTTAISAQKKQGPTPASRALAMCLVAEGQADAYACDDPSPEWETAAAQLIATTVGKRVYDCKSKQGLTYNEEDLVSECFIVE